MYTYLRVTLADSHFSNVKCVTSMLHSLFAKDTLRGNLVGHSTFF